MSTALDQAKEHYRRGDLAGALSHYERAAELLPDDPEPCFGAGVVSDKMGDNAAAVRHFDEALKRKPTFGKAYVNLAAVHAEAGRYREARETIERGLALGDRAQHKMLEELLSQLVAGILREAKETRPRAAAALTAKATGAAATDYAKLLSGLAALAGESFEEAELIADETGEPTFLIRGAKRKLSAQIGPAGSVMMVNAETGEPVAQLVLEPDIQWASGKVPK